ncbi:MAG: leucine-rich repeat domain-containing protein, partial [Oscillospiraceae bacterium]|nr:leucine-rich repeat domain-containing protein [Oscillospiraceae bacterium]
MKKKLLSFLTSAVLAATCLGGGLSELTSRIHLVNEPLTAEAYDGTAYGDLYYTKVDSNSDGTYDYVEITDCDSSAVSVEIPAEIDGLPVTSIRYEAFADCKNLTSVTIPDSVTSIRYRAFSGCKYLESITIPDSVTSIGYDAFSGTALLANQTGVKYADTWIVACDTDVTSVEIKDGTRGIAYYAFSDCTSLENITIPDSVTSIESYAFRSCASLVSITIPDSVTSIESSAFYGCTSL